MTDRDRFLAGIRENPEDRVRQLAFADFVEESGDADQARLIRDGVYCCGDGFGWSAPGDPCRLCDGKGWQRRCEHEGCANAGDRYVIEGHVNGERDDIEEWLCGEHASDHGYCRRCGGFFAGIESFEFSQSGLCMECLDDVRAEDEADERDAEDYYLDGDWDDET